MLALFSSLSASTADDNTVATQVRSRVDVDTFVQVSYASSVLKVLFLVQRFLLEEGCRNRSQIYQRWLMILICRMGQPSISSQGLGIIYVSTCSRPSVNACQYRLKMLLLGPSYFLLAWLSFTYDCPNFAASYDFEFQFAAWKIVYTRRPGSFSTQFLQISLSRKICYDPRCEQRVVNNVSFGKM